MTASYNGLPVPTNGAGITYSNGRYQVPDRPIVPFIEGDGTGRDIWKASVRVFDAAVEKAYLGKRRVAWYEIFAGEKAKAKFDNWLPDDSVNAIRRSSRSQDDNHCHRCVSRRWGSPPAAWRRNIGLPTWHGSDRRPRHR